MHFLGKKPARVDQRTLKLATYTAHLPDPPESIDYVSKVASWPMMGNDQAGDCTFAAGGHFIQGWTTYAGKSFVPPDADILAGYSALTGYDPANPASDGGAVMLDVLNYWRQTGIAGHKIAAYVALNLKDPRELKLAIQLFGGIYLGVDLPLAAMRPTPGANKRPTWLAPPSLNGKYTPGNWGGHCIPIFGYRPDHASGLLLPAVTWAQVYDVASGFLDAYGEEGYAVLSEDWIAADGESPSGFDLGQLQADLAFVTS